MRHLGFKSALVIATTLLGACGLGGGGVLLSQEESRDYELALEGIRYRSDLKGYSDEQLRQIAGEGCEAAQKAGVKSEEELAAFLVGSGFTNGGALLVFALNDASGGDCLR